MTKQTARLSSRCFLLFAAVFFVRSSSFVCDAFSSSSTDNNNGFSLSEYWKARALETSNALDCSRFHFQILFVDDDNSKGRIARGLLDRIAEYNDAMCVLFPACATITQAYRAPRDAAAPQQALDVCEELGLCPHVSEEIGTAFDLSCLDEYDLIICMNDDIRDLILRSIHADFDYYAQKCHSLGEFLSLDFCSSLSPSSSSKSSLLDMLEQDLVERVAPFADFLVSNSNLDKQDLFCLTDVSDRRAAAPYMILNADGAAVPNTAAWSVAEAGMILATAGVTRFCLDAMDSQLNSSLDSLLERNVYQPEHLRLAWETVDAQLQRCNAAVHGYFSPQQRKAKFVLHVANLKERFKNKLKP